MPLDFTFTEEQEMLRRLVRDFADREVRPKAKEFEEKKAIPREIVRAMADLGFFGVAFPEEYGGSGMGETGYCILQEELCRGDFSTANLVGASEGIGGMAIYVAGSEEQKKRFLPPLCRGERIGAYALSEADAGSDPGGMKTTATRDGAEWVLAGEKTWITNGDIADLVVVFAATDRAKGSRGGISAFVVEASSKGYRVGKNEDKMGQRASSTTQLVLENVRVPEGNLLGAPGDGFKIAMRTLDRGRVSLAAACLGASKECLALSTKYANERTTFGKPIGEHQAIQWMLADSAAEIFALESMVYRTAWMCDRGDPFTREAAIVKLAASEALDRIVDRAVQIHGGMGYSREFPVERWYRDARVNRIYEGSSEIQRIVIARETLKRGGW